MRKQSAVLALVIGLCSISKAEASASYYDQGMVQYKQGQFRKAAQLFTAATLQEPTRQIHHYLLANCLVRIDQNERAAEEYKLAYMLDASSPTGEFCKKALLAYGKRLPAVKIDEPLAQDDIGRAKKRIQKQASFEKDKHEVVASRTEQEIKAKLDEQLKAIDQQMQYEIERLHDPIVFNGGAQANRLLAVPELMKEREDQIRTAAAAQKERLIREAAERSKPYDSWRKSRSALVDEAAENLQTQLDQPVGPSGVKLQTRGTNLYVRYYGKANPNEYPDAHSATARIQEASGPDISSPTMQKNSHAEEVQGKVLRNPNFVNTFASK